MDFEPFHSDGDEEMASIMPEKKKKDGEKWKKSKGGPLFRNDKKMTFNDMHSPPGIKGKHSVHGVVGPADYIYEQGNSAVTEQPPTLLAQAMSQSSGGLPVSSTEVHPGVPQGGINVSINQSTRTEIPQQPSSGLPQKPTARADLPQQSSHAPGIQKQYSTSVMPDHPHPSVIQKQYSTGVLPDHPHPPVLQKQYTTSAIPDIPQSSHVAVLQKQYSIPINFQPNFPPISTIPTKIDRERPHCSPAALPQIPQIPQGPTPFKHPTSTLLSQAMGITQFQQPSVPSPQPMQVTAGNHTPYARNQSYSQAISVPIPIPEPSNADFSVNHERTISTTQEYPESPLPESIDGRSRGSIASPPLSPFGSEIITEGVWPLSEAKVSPVPHEYVDSAWANFHPAVPLQDPYDGDNDENRRKSHGTDSLSESIPESMSSVDSELDDSVWKINNEQREYYTKQFKKIQPDVAEVIKGPQARDFFLKSNLPNETLSTIWQLSDMDKDAALNLNEFYIAMHLVVAVKHGVELPTILPATLLCGSFSEEPLVSENLHESDEENKASSISDDESISSSVDTINSESLHARKSSQPTEENSGKENASPLSPDSTGNFPYTPIKDLSSRVRPRASVQKNVNLMDSSPWQLLPPPSSKGKPLVKKNLNMDDDAAFTSNESIEQINSFSSPEQIAKEMSSVNEYVFSDDSDNRANKTQNNRTRGMPKEKSRSIDSLRLDMNEDYTSIEMRRISRELRPRSFSGEAHHVNGSSSQRTVKEMEIPPVPPPREKGHVRACSLDSSKIFSLSDPDEITSVGVQLQKRTEDIKLSILPKPGSGAVHGEDDKSEDLSTKEKATSKEIPPSSIMANSPRSSRLHSPRDLGNETVKHVVRFSDELDVHDDPLNSPNLINKKMRKHELQARVRLLKSYNTTLNNMLTQLHMEWKSVSEERIALDIMLQKEKQQGLS